MSLLYYKQKLLSTSVDGRKSSSLQKFCRILSTAGQITIHRVKSDRKTAKKFLCKKTQKSSESLRILLSATLGDCPSRCVAHLAIARRGVSLACRLPGAVSAATPAVCPSRCVACLAIARRGVSLAWRLPVAVCRSPGFTRRGVSLAWRLPVAESAATPGFTRRGVSLAWRLPVAVSACLAIACRFFVFRTRRPKKLPEAARKRLRATLIYKIVLLERNVFIKSAGKMLSNRTFLRRRAGQGDRVPERAFPVF